MSDLTRKKPKKGPVKEPLFRLPAIISLGSGGGRILSHISTATHGATKIAVNNSERDLRLLRRGVNHKILVGKDHGGSGMDVEKGRNDFILGATRVVQEIRKAAERRHFKEIDLIAVIATLGHGFASGAYPEAMKLLRSEFPDTIIMSFAVTPFHFQGPEIRNRALEALKICKREGVAVTPISNQVAGQKLGTDPRKLGYMEAYTKINEQISRLLSSLFSAMCAEDGVVESLDRNDLKRIWQPESVLIGQATYPIPTAIGQSSPSDAERTIFAEIRGRGGKAVASYPTTYIIDTSGHVSTSQIAALNEELTTNYLADWGLLKPLIIERERSNTEFMLIRGGVDLGV